MFYNMVAREEILLLNISEYMDFAGQAYRKGNFNTAVTLYFKAMAAMIDLHLLRKEGAIPSSHSNRFRILKEKYARLYDIADRDFPFYQDSYTNRMDKEAADLLKEDAEEVKKILEK